MLGTREPEIYGSHSYYELIEFIKDNSTDELEFFQSNIEGEIINKIHEAKTKGFEGIVIRQMRLGNKCRCINLVYGIDLFGG